MSVLVIGYGNTLRSDDGAGIRAAETISRRYAGTRCMCVQQIGPTLAEAVAGHDIVVFIDASLAATSLRSRDLRPTPVSKNLLSHTCSPEELLGLVGFLYGKTPARALLLEVPASSTEFGETLTPLTRRAVSECVDTFGELMSLRGSAAGGPAF